jgi:hypothetical protein
MNSFISLKMGSNQHKLSTSILSPFYLFHYKLTCLKLFFSRRGYPIYEKKNVVYRDRIIIHETIVYNCHNT